MGHRTLGGKGYPEQRIQAGRINLVVAQPMSLSVQIKNPTDIEGNLMDIGPIYTDIGELNRHQCRSIQSWPREAVGEDKIATYRDDNGMGVMVAGQVYSIMLLCEAFFALSHKASLYAISGSNASRRMLARVLGRRQRERHGQLGATSLVSPPPLTSNHSPERTPLTTLPSFAAMPQCRYADWSRLCGRGAAQLGR